MIMAQSATPHQPSPSMMTHPPAHLKRPLLHALRLAAGLVAALSLVACSTAPPPSPATVNIAPYVEPAETAVHARARFSGPGRLLLSPASTCSHPKVAQSGTVDWPITAQNPNAQRRGMAPSTAPGANAEYRVAAEVPVTLSYTRVAPQDPPQGSTDKPTNKYCNASAHFVPKRDAQYEITTMADPNANRCAISVVQIAPMYAPVVLERAGRCAQMDGAGDAPDPSGPNR
jgi:hypothetical protein